MISLLDPANTNIDGLPFMLHTTLEWPHRDSGVLFVSSCLQILFSVRFIGDHYLLLVLHAYGS